MSCPTCDHTMQNLGLAQSGARVFWCPRCGSLKTESTGGFVETEQPALVQRVKDAIIEVSIAGNVFVPLQDWRSIDEASGFWKNNA